MSALSAVATRTPSGVRDVHPREVSASRDKVRLVDVREPHEYRGDLGHIPGAELVPLQTLPDAAKSWDKNTAMVLICRSGGRSSRATALLASMGFSNVFNMAGGMLAYNDEKLLVER
jgi:rhodanese-related sulfurtransferase